jgi:hypothetical protein
MLEPLLQIQNLYYISKTVITNTKTFIAHLKTIIKNSETVNVNHRHILGPARAGSLLYIYDNEPDVVNMWEWSELGRKSGPICTIQHYRPGVNYLNYRLLCLLVHTHNKQ